MPAEAAQKVEALAAQAQRLMGTFARAGYEHIAPAMIQPAGLFLDVVGEALRARTYVFTDPDGEELCLRPDLTVPTCRLHLARHPAGDAPARYCYSGLGLPLSAGRRRPARTRASSARPASSRSPRRTASRTMPPCSPSSSRRCAKPASRGFQLRFGDLGLFTALLDALPMPQRWRRRLRHHFWRPEAFRAELARLTSREALQAHGRPARADRTQLDPDAAAGGPGPRRSAIWSSPGWS